MYSVWLGSETEQRAVFVDEVKCIGCLKCALFADKTFAVEAVYGRAHVVAQWADPEHKIQESIDACPVNCFSMVERSDLATLEFIMSKQPRGNVRVGAGNTAGARVFDVFSELKVFHKRLQQAMDQKSQEDSKGAERSQNPSINKLEEAVARDRNILNTGKNPGHLPQTTTKDDYWVPLTSAFPLESKDHLDTEPRLRIQTASAEDSERISDNSQIMSEKYRRNPLISSVPVGLALIAAVVRLREAGDAGGRLEEHIGGSVALEIVNSPWLQVVLAGAAWYIAGQTFIQLVESLANKSQMK